MASGQINIEVAQGEDLGYPFYFRGFNKMQVDKYFADRGLIGGIGIVGVHIKSRSSGQTHGHAGRQAEVKARRLGDYDGNLVLHDPPVEQIVPFGVLVIACGVAQVAVDLWLGNNIGRGVAGKLVEDEVVTPQPHGQFKAVDEEILGVVEGLIKIDLALVLGCHLEGTQVELDAIERRI